MQYIIMCGGHYSNWKTPRQLILVNDEPVVVRTIRLLQEAGVAKSDIYISSNDERFESFDVNVLHHDNDFQGYVQKGHGGHWVDCFYPTYKPTCYLMGDVIFSPNAIKTIVNTQTDGIQFFASAPPFSPEYSKQWAEPFGFKVIDQMRFRKAIDFVKTHDEIFRRRPIAWELWQVINGEDVNSINYGNYCVINDYTCDIDSEKDMRNFKWRNI